MISKLLLLSLLVYCLHLPPHPVTELKLRNAAIRSTANIVFARRLMSPVFFLLGETLWNPSSVFDISYSVTFPQGAESENGRRHRPVISSDFILASQHGPLGHPSLSLPSSSPFSWRVTVSQCYTYMSLSNIATICVFCAGYPQYS